VVCRADMVSLQALVIFIVRRTYGYNPIELAPIARMNWLGIGMSTINGHIESILDYGGNSGSVGTHAKSIPR